MWYLIIYEWKRALVQKKNWIILMLVIAILFSFIKTKIEMNELQSFASYQDIKGNIEIKNKAISDFRKNQIDNPEVDFSDVINRLQNEIDYLMNMHFAIMSEDTSLYLENKIALDEEKIFGIQNGNVSTDITISELEDNIEMNKILLEKGISPIITRFSMNAWNYPSVLLNSQIVLIFLFLTIFFTSSLIPQDFEKGSSKLLYTQPISKFKFFSSKLLSALSFNYAWLLILLIGSFFVLYLKEGAGNSNYPIQLYLNQQTSYICVREFYILAFLMLFLLMTLTILITFLISILAKNTSVTLMISTVIIFSTYMLRQQGTLESTSHINPFSYLDITNILKGEVASLMKNVNLDFQHFLLVVLISITSILIGSIISFYCMKVEK